MPAEFSLHRMEVIKENELPDIRLRIKDCGNRSRPLHRLTKPESPGIIAELKRASPSRGAIRNVPAEEQAGKYRKGGAAGLSVLTDNNFFGGTWDDLLAVADSAMIPVLCKEFVFFNEQIELAFLYGADLVLLIARALSGLRLRELYCRALALGITPLIEVHDSHELSLALALNPEYLMVNLRNLETLAIDEETGIETLSRVPENITSICASGIDRPGKISEIYKKTGTTLFLIGTALMQARDPIPLMQELCHVR